MIEMNVVKLSKSFGATDIFRNITFEVHTKDRIGIVGRNGCGKTRSVPTALLRSTTTR